MCHRLLITVTLFVLFLTPVRAQAPRRAAGPAIRKLEDIVIYEDAKFYAAFPSIVQRPNGELLVAFRRAPERRVFGEAGVTHTDPNSYLVLVRSTDSGKTWTREPQLISAHPWRAMGCLSLAMASG